MSESKINATNETSCFRVVDDSQNQCVCGKALIRNGKTKYGKQRLVVLQMALLMVFAFNTLINRLLNSSLVRILNS